MDEITSDAIFRRRLTIRQRRDGYRFSIDALLLAWFAARRPGRKVLELGTGSGVVSIACADRCPEREITAVEVQEGLAGLARENVALNGLNRIRIVQRDIRDLAGAGWDGAFDLVIANPPFRAVGHGRLNPEREKAIARHELLGTLADFVACADRCLTPDGRAVFILLAEREPALLSALAPTKLALFRRVAVRPYADRTPNLLLVELGRECIPAPDGTIVIWREYRRYTPLVEAILDGRWDEISGQSDAASRDAGQFLKIILNN
jgi:tRNA1Val (adenine37-N6)-methyltransferase